MHKATSNLHLLKVTTGGEVNNKSRQQEQLTVFYVLPALTTILLASRLFSRMRLDAGIGADDWTMVAAHIAYLFDVGAGLGIALNGFGQHTYFLTTRQVVRALKVH